MWERCSTCGGDGVVVEVVVVSHPTDETDELGYPIYYETQEQQQAQCGDCYATGQRCPACGSNPRLGHAPYCEAMRR